MEKEKFQTFVKEAKFHHDILLVFDLDMTMWPFHLDMETDPPFKKTESKIIDSRGRKVNFYPDAEGILQSLKLNPKIRLACASRTTDIEGAKNLLVTSGWNNLFEFQEIYPSCKVKHFKKLFNDSKIDFKQMVFFDDFQYNLNDVSRLGVKGVLVNNGIQYYLVKNALMSFL